MIRKLQIILLFLPNLLVAQNDIQGNWVSNSIHPKVYCFHFSDSLSVKSYGENASLLNTRKYKLQNDIKNTYVSISNEVIDSVLVISHDKNRLQIKTTTLKRVIELHQLNRINKNYLLEHLFEDKILEVSTLKDEQVVESKILYRENNRFYMLKPKYSCSNKISFKLDSSEDRAINILHFKNRDYKTSILVTDIEESLIKGITLERGDHIEIKLKKWIEDKASNSMIIGEWIHVLYREKLHKENPNSDRTIYKGNPVIRVKEDLSYEMEYQGLIEYGSIRFERYNNVLCFLLKAKGDVKDKGERIAVREMEASYIIFNRIICIRSSEDYEEDMYWKKARQ